MTTLAIKYRPHTWDEVVAQKSIVRILRKQCASNQIKNSYLFCGASGCGKTTAARIFANEINQGKGSPIEIDGASNNGVDNVKSIIKAAVNRSIDSVYKVYIIDECHMITTQGWNAFLKCIEEPPQYTVFIFCTTDPEKVPATILNRCQRFNFTRIPTEQICERLDYVLTQEGIMRQPECVEFVAKCANGSMREALTLLDKALSYSEVLTLESVIEALGTFSYESLFDILKATVKGDCTTVVSSLEKLYEDGKDLRLFVEQFLAFVLDLCKYILIKDISCTKIPKSLEALASLVTSFENASQYYNYLLDKLLKVKNAIKLDNDVKTTLEAYFLQICRGEL